MAWILTLIGSQGTPVNLQVSEHNRGAQQALDDLLKTQEGKWATVDAIVDGEHTPVHVRPDLYGMIFLHWRDDVGVPFTSEASMPR